jgi:DNA-binding transcriptional regulator YiaG
MVGGEAGRLNLLPHCATFPPMKNIGKELRLARGKLPREQAAKILGVSVGALIKWERGERMPSRLAQPELLRRLPLLRHRQPA